MSEPTTGAPSNMRSTPRASRQARSRPPTPVRRGSAKQRVAVPPQVTREAEVIASCADNYARRQRERAEARSRTERSMQELDTAIGVGDRSYRRLRHRLDDYGTHLDEVRSRLRHDGYMTHWRW